MITIAVSCPSVLLAQTEYQLDWASDRVANLKALVRDTLADPKPDEPDMRFIFSGRILKDEEKISSIIPIEKVTSKITFHLVINLLGRASFGESTARSAFATNLNGENGENGPSRQVSGGPSLVFGQSRSPEISVLRQSAADASASSESGSETPEVITASTSSSSGGELTEYTLTDGLLEPIKIAAYECLIINGSNGEKAVAFSPPALERIEKHFAPRYGADIIEVLTNSIAPTPTRTVPIPGPHIARAEARNQQAQTNGGNGNGHREGFETAMNNRYVQLQVNFDNIGRSFRQWFILAMKILTASVLLISRSSSWITKVAIVLVLLTTLGRPVRGHLEQYLVPIRQRVQDLLPHGAPEQLNLDNYEHLWQARPAPEAEENNEVQNNERNNEHEEDGQEDNGEDDQLEEFYADHTRQLPWIVRIRSTGFMLVGSLVPAIYDRWIAEENRRRNEVREQVNQRRRAEEDRVRELREKQGHGRMGNVHTLGDSVAQHQEE